MLKLRNTFVLLLFLPGIVIAQQQDTKHSTLNDSVYRHLGINPVLNVDYELFNDLQTYDFSLSGSNQLLKGDTSTLWLRTEFALSHMSAGNPEENGHFLLPFYKRYLENSKINPITYVLGLAQTAAVGYMAYRHIKKYGFFK